MNENRKNEPPKLFFSFSLISQLSRFLSVTIAGSIHFILGILNNFCSHPKLHFERVTRSRQKGTAK